MAMYPSEFNIYATVSKVELTKQSSKSGGTLHLFVLDGKKGTANANKVSHQGHLLREMMGSSWVEVSFDSAAELKKVSSGDLLSLSVVVDNTKDKKLRSSPNRFGLPIHDRRLNNLVSFIHDAIGHKFNGDKEIKGLFGIFGDELFNYATKNLPEFVSKARKYGASLASITRFTEKAESHMLANEAFDILRKASVDVKSATRIVSDYGGNTYNHLESNPWYFCQYPHLSIKYRDNGYPTSSLKAKVSALDEIYKMINGTSQDLDSHVGRGYWIYSSLVHEGHNDGHTAVSRDDLIEAAYESRFYGLEQSEQMLDTIVKYGSFIESEDANGLVLVSDKLDFEIEKEIIEIIKERMSVDEKTIDDDKLEFEDFFTKEQRQAVSDSIKHQLSVITGGAGTGKTTVIRSIIKNFISHDNIKPSDIILLAPTGKAKDRMKESTGYDARTIHKLITKQKYASKDGQVSPYAGKVFIVDEAGMLDSQLMLNFLKIVPKDAHVVFVGDFKQLAPVKHGQPFKDLLVTKYIASTRLSKPQRTSGESEIHQAAMLISEGMEPEFSRYQKEVTFFSADKDDVILDEIIRTLTNDFEDKFETSLDDTVVLAPMNVGTIGVRNLNKVLKPYMNPSAQGEGVKVYGKGPFHEGDRIIINKNDDKNDIANGDVGTIEKIGERGELTLLLRGKTVTLYGKQRKHIDHAFCLTVHKTQGSEYSTVVMAMSDRHKRMLTPELFYTGVTRAKQNFVLIGSRGAVSHACSNENRQVRTTYMEAKLKKMAIEKGVIFENDKSGAKKKTFDMDDFGFSSTPKTKPEAVRVGQPDSSRQESPIEIIPLDAYDENDIPPGIGDDYSPQEFFEPQYSHQPDGMSEQEPSPPAPEPMSEQRPPNEGPDPCHENKESVDLDISGINTSGNAEKEKPSKVKDNLMDFEDFQF